MGVEGLDSVHQLQSVCKTHVVELNKLGRGQAEIQACGGTELQRAPACVQPSPYRDTKGEL